MSSPLLGDTTNFTEEQKQFLAGLFSGAMQRVSKPFVGLTSTGQFTSGANSTTDNLAAEHEPTVHGTPISDLCREELWKHEQNPLDIWDKLIAHSDKNGAPAADDIFRFKYHGLFYVAPAQDSFMMRLRIRGGVLTSNQLHGLAEIAEQWGGGRADLTTRANIQIRELQPKDIVRVLHRVDSLGLTARGSGADNIRNITASPTTGLDATELYDVAPLAEALHYYILNSRDLYELPRKFNVAFDSGGSISVLADTNDIGFQAVRVAEGRSVPAGIYFRVLLCGITGHKQFASDCGLLVRPEETLAVAAGMIRVFIQHGDRTDRKKARLKYLVDRWGVEKFVAETEKQLALPLRRVVSQECDPRGPIDRAGHIGVHPQVQSDLNYIGVSIPVGRLPVKQMRCVARIADEFGSGELRLTVWQNLLIPNVQANQVSEVVRMLREAGLACDAGTVMRGTVACTGNQGCRYASTDTKSHAVELAQLLDARFNLDQPVNLHVTGCSHSCAQHYVGDIGLLGVKVGGAEGYQVVIGGGSDEDRGLARELIPAIPYRQLPSKLEALFQSYVSARRPNESFLDFSRRHSVQQLREFLDLKEVVIQ